MRLTLFGAIAIFNTAIFSHPLDLGSLLVTVGQRNISVQLDVSPRLVEKLLPETNAANLQSTPQSIAEDFFVATVKASPPLLGGEPCHWQSPTAYFEGANLRLVITGQCAKGSGKFEWSLPFLKKPEMPPTFQLVSQIKDGRSAEGPEKATTLDRNNHNLTFSMEETATFGNFILMGIAHIGAVPSEWKNDNGFKLPDGFDHIVFLFALLLAGGNFITILKTITGFTLGHSITLAFGALGWIRLSPSIIEPAIALSIAYIAVETLFFSRPEKKWRIAAFFGLIHGCGFAAALTEMHLGGRMLIEALLGFNVGVEVGQLILMIALLPPLTALARFPRAQRPVTRALSIVIFFTACYWFVERTFL